MEVDNTVKMYYYLFDLNLNLFLTLKRQITEYFEINVCFVFRVPKVNIGSIQIFQT